MWVWLIKKVGGSVVGSFLAPFLPWIIAGTIATVVGAGWIYYHGAEKAKKQVGILTALNASQKADFDEAIAGYDTNKAALDQCLAANALNAHNAVIEAGKAKTAADNVTALRAELDRQTGEIHADSEALRGKDQECRSVDQPLPAWFAIGLRN